MNIIVITARFDSERLPGKALIDLGGQPNLMRLVERLRNCRRVDYIVVAIPEDDSILQAFCADHAISFSMGAKDDVLSRVLCAAQAYTIEVDPGERVNVMRLTMDCPFISWELVDQAFDLFRYYSAVDTARLWGSGERVPVYGAGEFPVSLKCLEKMDLNLSFDFKEAAAPPNDSAWKHRILQAREHVTADIDANRLQYHVAYPIPPKQYWETFYRPYRLELDTPQDLELVNKIISELGINPPLHQVIRFLDANPEIAQINAGVMEKTGPSMYSLEQRARWKSQQSMNTVEWRGDWSWLNDIPEIPKDAKPIYCRKGRCYLGYVKRKSGTHILYTKDGHELTGLAVLNCACGAGRTWREG